ncbi:MAG: TA system VapC family ribonuclease toxin [Myxococcales bacterium]
MIAVDTNILLHAHRADSPFHSNAAGRLRTLAAGTWAIPWPCLHEFVAVATHPRIFAPPTPLADALRAADLWTAAPHVRLISEREGYWELFEELVSKAKVAGPRIHDARIATLCIQEGVEELWTADRDFSRFAALRTRNPLTS